MEPFLGSCLPAICERQSRENFKNKSFFSVASYQDNNKNQNVIVKEKGFVFTVSSPSGVWGRRPSDQRIFGCVDLKWSHF